MAEAIGQFDDQAAAVDQALQIVAGNPTLSFGKYDYLVAQSLVLAARQRMPNELFEPPHGTTLDESTQLACQLAAQRLAIFLDGPWGNPSERAEAQKWLTSIQNLARQQFPLERWSPDELATLPTAPRSELERQIADWQLSPWNRGRAAMAVGRMLENAGDVGGAQQRYLQALEFMRLVFPFVSGLSSETQAHVSLGRMAESPECRLMNELLADLQRLDPSFGNVAAGGIALSVEPSEWLGDMELGVMIELFDPSVGDPNSGLSRNLSHHVYIDRDAPRRVRVLDGTYRIKMVGIVRSWTPVHGVDPELLEVVADGWPMAVEVRGGWFELPPLKIRKLEEIELLEPVELARVDLRGLRLTWTPIEGAVKYQVQIGHFVDAPEPQSYWYATIETDVPSLLINEVQGPQRAAVKTHWQSGRVAGFRVQAIGADGQRLGLSKSARRFLIATELPQ